jgi:hypothetical protein
VQACPTDISCHERDEIRASKGGRKLLFTLDPMPRIVQLIVIGFLIDIAAGMLYKKSVKCGCLYISNVRTRSLPRMVERYASLRGDAAERKAPKKVRPTRGWDFEVYFLSKERSIGWVLYRWLLSVVALPAWQLLITFSSSHKMISTSRYMILEVPARQRRHQLQVKLLT